MSRSRSGLIALVDLEEFGQSHHSVTSPNEGWQRVYGSRVIGHALAAAWRSVPDDHQAVVG